MSFGYGAGPLILRDVSFDVRPGETALFCGASGAGKSSLMALIARFYEPREGRVELDGHPVSELPLAWLRRQIAFVSQETFLFFDTVMNNIRVGDPVASDEEVTEAAGLANALAFIEALPEGLETRLGERGCRLSGGRRQRIAVARALLKDAPVLVLDEATSAVDPKAEREVYEALERLRADRTTLIVAHHAGAFVDRVHRRYVVETGRVSPASASLQGPAQAPEERLLVFQPSRASS